MTTRSQQDVTRTIRGKFNPVGDDYDCRTAPLEASPSVEEMSQDLTRKQILHLQSRIAKGGDPAILDHYRQVVAELQDELHGRRRDVPHLCAADRLRKRTVSATSISTASTWQEGRSPTASSLDPWQATETEMPDFGVLGQDGGSPKSQWQATPVPETEMPDFGAFGQVQEDCFGAWPPVTTWSHWHNLSAYDYSAYCWEGWLGQWPSQPELTAGPIHRSNATRNRRSAKQSQRK
ncbi:unnamed protein product [Effrenium voratum]|nr:unnamed protein product [Effrenium voratum]CAJ1414000.1 unnamed protein product [Effrenium voratum]